jgi:hypothetical protein
MLAFCKSGKNRNDLTHLLNLFELHFTLSKKSCFKLGVRNRADHKPNWKNTKIQKLCQTYLKIRCRCAKFTQTRIAKYRWGIQQIKKFLWILIVGHMKIWIKFRKKASLKNWRIKKAKLLISPPILIYSFTGKKHW